MAQLVAVLQSQAALLPCLLDQLDARLGFSPAPGQAMGVGYFENGKVLLRKRPVAPGGTSLAKLAGDVHSEVLVASVHSPGPAGYLEENTQPHRFRAWLFAGAGRILPLGERAHVLASLPEFLRRGVTGQSDAELAFLVTLGHVLEEARSLDLLALEPDVAARALARTLATLDARAEQVTAPRAETCAVVSNGRMLAAVRRGSPLYYRLVEGLQSCERCDLDAADAEPRARAHRQARAVVLATHPHAADRTWIEIPDRHLITVSRSLALRLTPLG